VKSDNRHKSWLTFVRKVFDVAANYTVEELSEFRSMAERENSALGQIVDGYYKLARRSESRVMDHPGRPASNRTRGSQMHLFDLLREKKFFPMNSDLALFAERVVPRMRAYSFDKMARSDIAARIIEFIENSDPRARAALEKSMRDALTAMKSSPKSSRSERLSFLSKWERIIKGLEL
jgi:hypothetical protein